MTYRFYFKKNASFLMTERNSRCPVAYYSKYKMNELYPDGGYEVIGEIGNLAKKYSGQDTVATEEGKNIPIFPRGSMKKPFEWVAGYAAIGENTYVAVIKSVIPRLI